MDQWKLETLLNEFEEACATNPHGIIRAAKRLRRAMGSLTASEWEQEREIVERMDVIMENGSAPARQCAACVVMDMPIQPLCTMPTNFELPLHDEQGKLRYTYQWEDPRPNDVKQQHEWMEFAAKHKIFIEDQRESGRG